MRSTRDAFSQDMRELSEQGPQRRQAEAELHAAIDSGDLALLEAALARARALRVSEEARMASPHPHKHASAFAWRRSCRQRMPYFWPHARKRSFSRPWKDATSRLEMMLVGV